MVSGYFDYLKLLVMIGRRFLGLDPDSFRLQEEADLSKPWFLHQVTLLFRFFLKLQRFEVHKRRIFEYYSRPFVFLPNLDLPFLTCFFLPTTCSFHRTLPPKEDVHLRFLGLVAILRVGNGQRPQKLGVILF